MKAKEARKIWEEAIALKAEILLDFIKKRILQYIYQENAFFYVFEFPNFNQNIIADEEQEFTGEFIEGIFDYITNFLVNLGFRVKSDYKLYKIWITCPKDIELKKDSFTENLINILRMRKNYGAFSEIEDILADIYLQIRKRAKESCHLNYSLTLNVPNTKSLLLDDLLAIIQELEQGGYTISLEGLLANQNLLSQKEYLLKAIDQGSILENLVINLRISW